MQLYPRLSQKVAVIFNQIPLCLFLAASLYGFMLAPPLSASTTEFVDGEKEGVAQYRIRVRRLEKIISRQEGKLEEAKKEERTILVELEGLDKKLIGQQKKLDELREKMARQQQLIDKQELALLKIRLKKGGVEEHLMKRINAYYTMGDIGLFNVTFSTKRFPELLSFHDAFGRLLQYDQDVIKRYQVAMREVERVKSALDLEKTVLEDFLRQTVYEKERLEEIKEKKNRLLTHIRTQSILHQQAINEMLQTSEELSKSILEIKSKNQQHENRFLAGKGRFNPPVEGTLTTFFHQEKVNKLGVAQKSQGIAFSAPDGTSVVAVDDGEVIFSGYLRGYGNTIIIHHGFQYYTVTSRVENILVVKGEKVRKGTGIGMVGAAATLFDEGLYFEIRHGQESLDPLQWLNPERLSPASNKEAPPIHQG